MCPSYTLVHNMSSTCIPSPIRQILDLGLGWAFPVDSPMLKDVIHALAINAARMRQRLPDPSASQLSQPNGNPNRAHPPPPPHGCTVKSRNYPTASKNITLERYVVSQDSWLASALESAAPPHALKKKQCSAAFLTAKTWYFKRLIKATPFVL